MLKSVTVAFSEPGPLDRADDLLAVADVAAGSVVDVAVLLFSCIGGTIIPKEARQSVGPGGLDDILHIVEIELPGPGVGLRPHRAAKLTDVARNILGDEVGVELAKNLLDVVLVASIRLLRRVAGVAPIGPLLITDGVVARIVEMD